MTIPVIIPAYCDPSALSRATECVRSSVGVEPVIFVLDNSPPAENILYTRAINAGLKEFTYLDTYKYCLVLTQDCYVRPSCLSHLVQFMEANPKAGIAAPLQLGDTYGTGVTWGGSLEAWPAGRHIINAKEELQRLGPQQVFWANGACFLVRCEMVRHIGLLDENMRFICSDSDYSFTARARGWSVWSVPDAQAEHTCAGSANTGSAWLEKIKAEDMLYFTKKWAASPLYRDLSYEGKKLTGKIVGDRIRELERTIAKLSALPPEISCEVTPS